jgi:uncharacterized membrane protein
MFRRDKTAAVKDSAAAVKESAISATEFASALAKDMKFRRELISAISHGTRAKRRAARKIGFFPAITRLSSDPKLRRELRTMVDSLDKVWSRVEKKRSHKLRNFLIVFGVGGAAAAAAASRKEVRDKVSSALPTNVGSRSTPRTIEESAEVNVPASVAYNQWTQFEDFPLFMEGVEHVQQLDDTRLHWVANVGGRKAEWDAKILEQHPDRQISWISEDGKKTRGTVTFEPLGRDKTHVRVSMSYQAEGPAEQVGSAAGLDARRVRADLERFTELVESRGQETGAWRGEIEAGQTKS